jgi:rubrerythrin
MLSFYMRKRALRRMGISGTTTMFGNSSLSYYCMSCGTKHNQAACPKCGSKMKRVGS